jgi:hypothetical protein
MSDRRHVRAFGLEIDSSVDAPGLPAANGRGFGPRATLDVVEPERIDASWPSRGAERVLEEDFGGRRSQPDRTIDVHPKAGWRLYARHFGLARVSPTGARIECEPPPVAAWRWQRFLVGRVLPWAAVLRGLEAFHASAVSIDGRAFAFVAPTGGGKTSVAVRLVAGGAGFLTDDVLALDRRDGVLRAHPGAGIASVRPAEKALIDRALWRRLGRTLGNSGKSYLELPREDGPLPLAAIYYLRPGEAATIERAKPDPRTLLASTFVLGVQTPKRLMNQLDVCAAIGREVPMFTAGVEPVSGAAGLAERIEEHARGLVGGARGAVGGSWAVRGGR